MTKPEISYCDIRDWLAGLAAAIELDQIRVDALPKERFPPQYDDGSWRLWRKEHLEFIARLLPTIDEIPPPTLKQIGRLAFKYESAVVNGILLGILADVASKDCAYEELTTAGLFLNELIRRVLLKGVPVAGDARDRITRWVPVTDPLGIAQDTECLYGVPSGCVN
ncbi:hypothetical protein JQ629_36275 [Bradyrhizobium sp. AUGA SZCCT0222]|uniref:hypothetical protein n=1 Tax=Bradyrhizobium sp. AUGA SZCCT0222 TaxID=2807668 RepID=UPI001BA92C55|nr:hypothetical protein [Bradyrhizobium sp. AUGA SZCCT0222]MBR1272938.1 hypothetical protein [Bradyrhizobium sp. AUGA SZCCT0222]